ncbi:hypothetical protein CCR75_002457 [Bremia lactucae]|uniref:RxLR effector protein n=1 Tax=Bremia lactucae TaxID=4779 RepID=A0A976IC61_BRELC|nr:hypothetical protein CCR75_002457 [Bremia lactucae]
MQLRLLLSIFLLGTSNCVVFNLNASSLEDTRIASRDSTSKSVAKNTPNFKTLPKSNATSTFESVPFATKNEEERGWWSQLWYWILHKWAWWRRPTPSNTINAIPAVKIFKKKEWVGNDFENWLRRAVKQLRKEPYTKFTADNIHFHLRRKLGFREVVKLYYHLQSDSIVGSFAEKKLGELTLGLATSTNMYKFWLDIVKNPGDIFKLAPFENQKGRDHTFWEWFVYIQEYNHLKSVANTQRFTEDDIFRVVMEKVKLNDAKAFFTRLRKEKVSQEVGFKLQARLVMQLATTDDGIQSLKELANPGLLYTYLKDKLTSRSDLRLQWLQYVNKYWILKGEVAGHEQFSYDDVIRVLLEVVPHQNKLAFFKTLKDTNGMESFADEMMAYVTNVPSWLVNKRKPQDVFAKFPYKNGAITDFGFLQWLIYAKAYKAKDANFNYGELYEFLETKNMIPRAMTLLEMHSKNTKVSDFARGMLDYMLTKTNKWTTLRNSIKWIFPF